MRLVGHPGARLATLAFGLMGAVALGWYVSAHPELLHLEAGISVRTAVGAAGGAALVVLVLLSPRMALVALLAILYLNLSDALIRAYGLPSLLQLLGVPLLVSAWVHHGRGALDRVMGQPLTWLAVAYVLVLLASAAWAERPDLAESRFADALKALVLYGITIALVTTRQRARLAAWTLVGAGALLGLLGLVHLVAGVDADALADLARSRRGQIYGSVFDRRLAGPLGDPNFFAQILVVLVPLALYLTWTEGNRRARLAAAACLALILAALVLTYSRGGALALGFVLVASLVAHGTSWRRILGGGLALLMAALLLLPSGFTQRLTTVWQLLPGEERVMVDVDSSFAERLLLVETAWEMFARNPALGVGAGNYTARFGEYAEHRGSAARDYTDPDAARFPHNLYLEVAAETGLLGLALFTAVLAAAFLTLARARLAFRGRDDPGMARLARSLQLALAGYLVSGLFLHGDFQRYLWVQLAMAAAFGAMAARLPRESLLPEGARP
ncbi:MAG TPA: O-antigen ligase family protein [Longimicrobiales bacterium]|nr:O-antigen ligase family protein [Longimicrobiales bacterium]